jgi:IS30 family transposase
VIDVEGWAEIRRMHRVERLSIREIHRRSGLHRETIRRALAEDQPPRYRRKAAPSKLDPFKEEIECLLRSNPRIPNTRIRELIADVDLLLIPIAVSATATPGVSVTPIASSSYFVAATIGLRCLSVRGQATNPGVDPW